jgi:hypothetical protein
MPKHLGRAVFYIFDATVRYRESIGTGSANPTGMFS